MAPGPHGGSSCRLRGYDTSCCAFQGLETLKSRSHAGAAGRLTVVAATSRPHALDPALRRPGRLDREVVVPIPSAAARGAILALHAARVPLAADVDLRKLASAAVGYSGADLAALCREAAMRALCAAARGAGPCPTQGSLSGLDSGSGAAPSLACGYAAAAGGGAGAVRHAGTAGGGGSRAGSEGGPGEAAVVRWADFEAALQRVRPSITRGWEAELAPAAWDDIGGLDRVKARLRQAVEWPLAHAGAFARLGLAAPRGVLLHGPPGCCKTTLARAAASATNARLQVRRRHF